MCVEVGMHTLIGLYECTVARDLKSMCRKASYGTCSLYVCMCVCVYVCVYVCMYEEIHVQESIVRTYSLHVCVYVYVCMNQYM